MTTTKGRHRSVPEDVRSVSTISNLYRQLNEIVALMSLMHFEKLRGNSLKISKYLKNADACRNVGCVPLAVVMAPDNGRHRGVPKVRPKMFDHFDLCRLVTSVQTCCNCGNVVRS